MLLLLAAWGAVVLVRSGRWLEAVLLTLPLIYVTGVHLPLLCEARQSLPVKPLVLILAAIACHGPDHGPAWMPLALVPSWHITSLANRRFMNASI